MAALMPFFSITLNKTSNYYMNLSDEDYVDSRIILANYIEEVWNDSQGV